MEANKLHAYMTRRDFNEATNVLPSDRVYMCKETHRFDNNTFLGDTGASTHMVGIDDGLHDCVDIDEAVIIGDGKELKATKNRKTQMNRDAS